MTDIPAQGGVIPLEKSSSLNGWAVFYIGQFIRAYTARVSVNITVAVGQRGTIANLVLPPDVPSWDRARVIVTYQGNFSGHAVVGVEASGSVNLGNQYNGGSLNFVGYLNCLILAL
jgi:hypothetical protein